MARLFVYGSLMNQEVLQALGVNGVSLTPAVLQGFQRVNVINESYPGIFAHPSASVDGVVTSPLSKAQLAVLDEFEGDYYQRLAVSVMAEGQPLACGVYAFKPEYYPLLSREPWSNDVFRSRLMKPFLAMYC